MDWTARTARRQLNALLEDTEVDAVLVLGIVGASHAARTVDLPKPVIAAPVLNPEVEGLPVEVRERPVARQGDGVPIPGERCPAI